MPDKIKQKLKVDTEKCMIVDVDTGKEADGLILLDILINQNEHHPHIYYKTISTDKNLACNCRLCAESLSKVFFFFSYPWSHCALLLLHNCCKV